MKTLEKPKHKVAFFSEMGFTSKVTREHANMRTEFEWVCALDADHYPLSEDVGEGWNKDGMGEYDFGIVIIPKNYIPFKMDNIKKMCKKVGFMQEGPSWYFQDLPFAEQIHMVNNMNSADFIFAHNDRDAKYYEGLLGKPTFINPTLMITDLLDDLPHKDKDDKVLVGGNFVRWYGGWNSFIVARDLGVPIWLPSMGKMNEQEKYFEEVNHLPYMDWFGWMKSIRDFKYAVHLNPNTIGGTFYLNCAYWGIPCVGNKHTNTQWKCFPETSVEPDDLLGAKKLVKKLRDNKHFYNSVSKQAKYNFNKHFGEEVYIYIMNRRFDEINKLHTTK